jgi:hypothetical protein
MRFGRREKNESVQKRTRHSRVCVMKALYCGAISILQIPFFMIKQSNDMISLIDGHDQRL